jgi:hypothetical protein
MSPQKKEKGSFLSVIEAARASEPELQNTGSTVNQNYNKPELQNTGSTVNQNYNKPELQNTGSTVNQNYNKPELQNTGSTVNQNYNKPELQNTGKPEMANLTIKVSKARRKHWGIEARKDNTNLTQVILDALIARYGDIE